MPPDVNVTQDFDRKKDELAEDFEQPGPDLPGDEEEPFDARAYFLSGNIKGEERLKWLEKRMASHAGNDEHYLVPYASKGENSDFDEQANYEYFEANYSWLNYKSGFIGFNRYSLENPGLDDDPVDFEVYLTEIDEDEWDQFVSDVKDVRNGVCMDENRSNELRMEAETEFFRYNYKDFVDALREQPWMHRNEYQWLLQAVGTLEEEDVAELCRKNEHYPESEGQGSVWLNLEKAALDVDPDQVIEVLEGYENWQQAQAGEEWEATKSAVWQEQASTGYLFDKEMKEQLADQPDLLQQYTDMDPRETRAFFDRVLNDAAENPKGNEYPRWTFVKAGYYDQPKIDKWLVMYPASNWRQLTSDDKREHIEASMAEFVQDYAIPALVGNVHKIAKEHPELPFKEGIKLPMPPPAQESFEEPFDACAHMLVEPIKVVDWLGAQGFKRSADDLWQWEDDQHQVNVQRSSYRNGDQWNVWNYDMSGQEQHYRCVFEENAVPFLRLLRKVKNREQIQEANELPVPPPPADQDDFDAREYFNSPVDTGKLVKETPTLRIIKPTTETVEHYMERNQQGSDNRRVYQITPLYMVIPKSDPVHRFLMGVTPDGTLYTPPFHVAFAEKALRDKDYSKDLRRFFRSHVDRYLKDGEEHMAMRMLAQIYGSKAVLKYLDKYDVSDDLKLKLGIDAAKRGDSKVAEKLLNHPALFLKPDTCSWAFNDWSDLSQFFQHGYQDKAESILSGEDVDASWVYDHKPEVKEVLEYVSGVHHKLIRELLPHRIIQPYEDGNPVMLTTELVKNFDDDDLDYWLGDGQKTVDPDGELEDIRDALQNAACDAWESVVKEDWCEGYKETVLGALDAEAKWIKNKLVLSVSWIDVEKWLEDAERVVSDLNDLIENHAPRAEPSEDYSKTSWSEGSGLDEAIDARLAELEPPDFYYDPNQLTMPDVMGPNPNEYLEVTIYDMHSPHGRKSKLKRKDIERWQRDEPWRLDPDQWVEYARANGIEIPPKEVPPAPSVGESLALALLEKRYDYATTSLAVPAPQSDFIFEWGRLNIPDEKLSFDDSETNPRETEQHVTVLYGLTVNEVPEELRQITEAMKPFPVYIGKVSLFRQETHDVVKLDVESPWLRKLSAEIRAAIPNENKYPDYKPHITIAYTKKGTCDHLEGVDIFHNAQESGVEAQFTAYGLVFKGAGDSDGNRVHDTLLFSRVKKVRPVESEPFNGVPFPLDPEHVKQFLSTRQLKKILM